MTKEQKRNINKIKKSMKALFIDQAMEAITEDLAQFVIDESWPGGDVELTEAEEHALIDYLGVLETNFKKAVRKMKG